MNKQDYHEISRRLRLPQRCPLVGYCQRWAWTIYFLNYAEAQGDVADIGQVLEQAGDLPPDYETRKIQLAVEAPEISSADDFYTFHNLCPEVPLFDRYHTPGFIPQEAITSMDWTKPEGLHWKEHKHFSECLEYIQNAPGAKLKLRRSGIPPKVRFEVLQRDGFKCSYCGRSVKEGITLHVDHRISVSHGGKDDIDNLVTSCDECNFGKGKASVH